jgi:hypothetical protein
MRRGGIGKALIAVMAFRQDPNRRRPDYTSRM